MADPGYTKEGMRALRDLLATIIPTKVADDWVDQRHKSRVQYDLPIQPGGKYTPYGVYKNIDVRPEKYLTTSKPTLTQGLLESGAGGEFSPLKGLMMPERYQREFGGSPVILAHEQQHAEDWKGRPNGYDDRSKLESVAKKMQGFDAENYVPTLTGRLDSGEVIPELRAYAAELPVWKQFKHSALFKLLTNDEKAMTLRRLLPAYNGLDAIVGVDENF